VAKSRDPVRQLGNALVMANRPFPMEAALRSAVAERLGDDRFGLWFGEGVRLGVDGDALTVGVPNRFFLDWIHDHYAGELQDAAADVAGRPLRLDLRIVDEQEPEVGDVVPKPEPDRHEHRRGPKLPIPKPSGPLPPVEIPSRSSQDRARAERPRNRPGRPAKRLDRFVSGPCNRLALASAVEMAESPGAAFNPLVIHGGIGLGKSHLLEGIGIAVRERHPGLKVVRQTAEAFTNAFLDALRAGGLTSFRSKYRNADVLILDDVHFLAAKRSTQEEFQHTLDALAASGSAIVLACDHHPRMISKLTDELITRFLGGMVVKLEAPDPKTRREILRAKAAERGVEVPETVLAYIADNLRTSVRELEGALQSVLALATLTGKRLDLPLAKSALRDTIRHTAQAVALKDIERAVCSLFDVTPDRLKSDSRARALTQPRMIAMHLARKHTGAAFSEIGRYFGGRNHSTVISADKKVRQWLEDEKRQNVLAGFETISEILATLERTLGT